MHDPSEDLDALADDATFVAAAHAGLYRWFCRLTRSPELAADLTQETFAAFWQSSQRKAHGIAPTTWLYAIGRNLWRKRMRDRKNHQPVPLDRIPVTGRSAEQAVQDREFAEAVERAVLELPPDLREAFTLRFWGAFAFEQIGSIQGVAAGQARWRYFAARRRLQETLIAWAPEHRR